MTTPLSTEEVAELRAQTPGAELVTHFNHAGSSLPPQQVLDAQIGHLEREARTGGYEAAADMAEEETAVYDSIARLIGGRPHEIARVEHATTGWNAGFWSLPMESGQRIVTAEAAYGANAMGYLRAVQRKGVSIDVVPSDASGQVDVAEMERRMGDDVALVAITHVPTNGGLVNPAAEVGAVAKAAGVPYLLDACQSVGQLHIDVHEIGCDLLSTTGRKYLRGPRGTGFLWASENIIDRLEPDHPDHYSAHWDRPDGYTVAPNAQRFELWEYSHAGWLGLGAAADVALDIGTERIEATVRQQADRFRAALTAAGGITMYDLGKRPCGLITLNVDGVDATTVKTALRAQDINVSVSEPHSTLWDATRRSLPETVRASVHYLTTDDEIDRVVAALVALR